MTDYDHPSCTCDAFTDDDDIFCPIHGEYPPDDVRVMAEALRAAVVENLRRQGLITDEQARGLLKRPLDTGADL